MDKLPLSGRQLQMCLLVAGGHSNAQIAARLGVSENTVIYHSHQVYSKLDVHNRAELVSKLLGRAYPDWLEAAGDADMDTRYQRSLILFFAGLVASSEPRVPPRSTPVRAPKHLPESRRRKGRRRPESTSAVACVQGPPLRRPRPLGATNVPARSPCRDRDCRRYSRSRSRVRPAGVSGR